MLKTIVILANSVKHHQHCVAGKCIVTKEWIRPVSSASGEALSDEQTKYINPHGEFSVKKKQKIEMRFESHNPLPNQPENYLISDNKWVQKYSIDNCELEDYLDFPENLWGKWKSVSYDELCSGDIVINQSLYLVKVTKLNLYLAAVGGCINPRQCDAVLWS